MKKLLLLSILLLSVAHTQAKSYSSRSSSSRSSYGRSSSRSSSKNDSGSYMLNMTGKTIVITFYAKNPITKKRTWFGTKQVKPFFLGKQGENFTDTMSSTMLPERVDLHPLTCYEMRIDALNSDIERYMGKDILKYIDKSFKNVSLPTPAVGNVSRDYRIELQGKQIVVTRYNTFGGIPIPGTKRSDTRQWPSKDYVAILNMNPQEQVVAFKAQIEHLKKDIVSIDKEIKKYRKKSLTAQMNNRKKMRDEKRKLMSKYEDKVEKLQKAIDAAPPIATCQDKSYAKCLDGTPIKSVICKDKSTPDINGMCLDKSFGLCANNITPLCANAKSPIPPAATVNTAAIPNSIAVGEPTSMKRAPNAVSSDPSLPIDIINNSQATA